MATLACHECLYLYFPAEADPCCECSPSNQFVRYTEGTEEKERLAALITAFKSEIANRRDIEKERDDLADALSDAGYCVLDS